MSRDVDERFSHPPQRPAKRRRLEEAIHELPAASTRWPATAFQQPVHIASFSYSPERELLLPSSGRHNEALRLYAEAPLGADLRTGFEEAVMRKEGVAEGLDALLDCLLDLPSSDDLDNLLTRASVVTWRGMMTRLLKAVFASRADDSWEMNAMLIDGTLYLEDNVTSEAHAGRRHTTDEQKLSTYYGYSFEAFSTISVGEERPKECWSGTVNTNVQWCSVVKTKLGDLRLVLGGEVDALQGTGDVGTSRFVELKTNMSIQSLQQETSFEKFKLLSMYLQSFLLGVRTIVVGFRTRSGQLTALQTFKTLEIPRLIRGKAHAWEPAAALAAGHGLATFIRESLSASTSVVSSEGAFRSALTDDEAAGVPYPVFRVRFDGARRIASVKQLEDDEAILVVNASDRQSRDRCGFLPREWVLAAKARQLRVSGQLPVTDTPRTDEPTVVPGPDRALNGLRR